MSETLLHSPSPLAGFSRHSLSAPSKTKPPDIFLLERPVQFYRHSWPHHHNFLHSSFSAHTGHPLNFLLTLTHPLSFLNHDSSGSNVPRDTYFGMRLLFEDVLPLKMCTSPFLCSKELEHAFNVMSMALDPALKWDFLELD